MKKALVMFFLFAMLVSLAFSTDFVARTTVNASALDEAFWVTRGELEQALDSTVMNIQSQGTTIDEYFDTGNFPSKIGIGYFLIAYLADEKIVE